MDVTAFLNQALNLVLVSPSNPIQNMGISGFLFDVVGDEDVNLDSDITDHFVEDNTAVQDHIALRAPKVTVRGYVGELSVAVQGLAQLAQSIVERLTLLESLIPTLTTQATQSFNNIQSISQVTYLIAQASNLYNIFANANASNLKQQSAFNYFMALWSSRTLCSVQTPFQIFNNMAIENVRALQPAESIYMGDFSVTFKAIRTVQSQISLGNLASMAIDRMSEQSGTKNLGSTNGLKIDTLFAWGNSTNSVSFNPSAPSDDPRIPS